MNEPIKNNSKSFDNINFEELQEHQEHNGQTVETKSYSEKSIGTDTIFKNDFKKLKNEILKEFIYPKYKNDLMSFNNQSKNWSIAGSVCMTAKYIFLVLSPIFTLAETSFKLNNTFKFISAGFTLIGLAFDQMAKYCNNNSKKYGDKINEIYKIFNISIKNIDEFLEDKSI